MSAAPQTVAVRQERDFIEATSRLASFRLQSEPGLAISPLQIRLTKDKLVLIAKLLETSEDVYRHPDMILDLVSKLGMRDRLSEVRALALVTDAALRVRDAERAMEICDRMVQTVHALRRSPGAGSGKEDQAAAAAEVAWRTCAQLGTGPTGTKEVRLKLLGHALILCPATEIAPLLANWRIVDQLAPTDPAARPAPAAPIAGAPRFVVPGQFGGGSSRPQSPLVEPTSDAATRAARTFGRAAALFPFGHHRARSATPSERAGPTGAGLKVQTPVSQHSNILASPPSSAVDAGSPLGTESHADRLTAALSNRFTSGVGWLIGADGA